MSSRQARYEKRKTSENADIGEIPSVLNAERRESCRMDLFRYLTTYFPNSTGLSPFSEDHRRVIERLQRCTLTGGRYVNAVFRGFAKTTIAEGAALWSTSYGHRKFVPIFGADARAADGNIDSIKMELAENDLLNDDFPEVCAPIRALENKAQRCKSQTYTRKCVSCPGSECEKCGGSGSCRESTHIEWTADQIVLPTIAGSLASGAIIVARGLTGGSRGMKHKRADGVQQRPDFVIIDDPQTEESSESPMQVQKRMGIIRKSILKLGGHNKEIAVIINGTIIQPDDLMEQFLDSSKFPSWQGERIKMVKRFADAHESLWLGEYKKIRETYDADVVDDQLRAHRAATEFYVRNRDQMDKGCIVSWEHCFQPETEISAIQHAYNSLIDDGPDVFASECQNEPVVEDKTGGDGILNSSQIAKKLNGLAKRAVPIECDRVVAYIDVQGNLLYWLVAAFGQGFTGAVLDYGAFPDQKREYFTLKDVRNTLSKAFPGKEEMGRIYAGLEALSSDLFSRIWKREDGLELKLKQCLVDSGFQPETVYKFCRNSVHGAAIMAAKGRGIGAAAMPMTEYTRKPGETLGGHWMIPSVKGKLEGRHVLIDTNYWKSFYHARLKVAIGDKSCLSLWGRDQQAHKMLADQICAEYGVKTTGRGRELVEWRIKPNHPDNHLGDCLAGVHVAAAMTGIDLDTGTVKKKRTVRQRPKVTYLN